MDRPNHQQHQSPEARPRRRVREGAIGALVVVLFVLAQLGSVAHHALVPHSANGHCSAHGYDAAPQASLVEAGCPAVELDDRGADGHEHAGQPEKDGQEGPSVEADALHLELCSIPTLGEVSPHIATVGSLRIGTLVEHCVRSGTGSQESLWQIPVFRLAPKQSPPHEA